MSNRLSYAGRADIREATHSGRLGLNTHGRRSPIDYENIFYRVPVLVLKYGRGGRVRRGLEIALRQTRKRRAYVCNYLVKLRGRREGRGTLTRLSFTNAPFSSGWDGLVRAWHGTEWMVTEGQGRQ